MSTLPPWPRLRIGSRLSSQQHNTPWTLSFTFSEYNFSVKLYCAKVTDDAIKLETPLQRHKRCVYMYIIAKGTLKVRQVHECKSVSLLIIHSSVGAKVQTRPRTYAKCTRFHKIGFQFDITGKLDKYLSKLSFWYKHSDCEKRCVFICVFFSNDLGNETNLLMYMYAYQLLDKW